jgi:UDP-N-acetylmuramate--alanine ligase
MKGVGTDIGTIHFIGIGGIGMSGIAEVMHNLGYSVQGSDVAEGYVVEGLRAKGIKVMIGHKAENLGDAAVVVTSTAIKRGNPEVELALENRVPVIRRAEMLAELMRLKSTVAVAGTHGKTTTTSMVAALLDAGGVDPTVINGGIINSYGSNARLGNSDWMVVEADESDGSFLRLDGTIAVVTNIDPEHLDHYGSFDRVKDAFAMCLSMARRCSASITPKCRQSCRACRTAASSPMASRRRPISVARMSSPFPVATASTSRFANVTDRSAASKGSKCRCPVATMC